MLRERSRAALQTGRKLLRGEPLLFLAVGGFNTILNYGLYLLGLLFFSYTVSFTLSYVTGLIGAYCLNSIFVFKEPLRLSSFLRYPIVYVAQYVIGVTLLRLLVEVAHVSPVLAPWLILVVTVPVTYRLSRYIIKRQATAQSDQPDGNG